MGPGNRKSIGECGPWINDHRCIDRCIRNSHCFRKALTIGNIRIIRDGKGSFEHPVQYAPIGAQFEIAGHIQRCSWRCVGNTNPFGAPFVPHHLIGGCCSSGQEDHIFCGIVIHHIQIITGTDEITVVGLPRFNRIPGLINKVGAIDPEIHKISALRAIIGDQQFLRILTTDHGQLKP